MDYSPKIFFILLEIVGFIISCHLTYLMISNDLIDFISIAIDLNLL